MADVSFKITAFDRVVAKTDEVHITLMVGEDRVSLDMDHQTALNIIQTVADALIQLREPGITPELGVALYEAIRFEGQIESIPGKLGLEEKFALTAHGQGSTKMSLRLDPSKVDEFLVQAEQHSTRKLRATKQ